METLYQHELVNIDGLRIRVTFFRRDARSPREIADNSPIRYEHVLMKEVYDEPTETWMPVPAMTNPNREEILEYLQFDDDGLHS
jgi:hypothetical protein